MWSYLDFKRKGLQEKTLLMVATSPADDWEEDKFVVPRQARSVFGDYALDEEFWRDLSEFDGKHDHESTTDFNVSIIVNQALSFIILHELGHLVKRHLLFSQDVLGRGLPVPADSSRAIERLLRKGLELEADVFAAKQLARLWQLSSLANGYLESSEACRSDFFRIGFALVMLLGAFDPRKRGFAAYHEEVYPHPIVRQHAIRASFGTLLKDAYSDRMADLWIEGGTSGWFRAVQCLNWFTFLECMDGAPANGMIPVHSLNYGAGASDPYISAELCKGQAVFAATERIRERYLAGELTPVDLEQMLQLASAAG